MDHQVVLVAVLALACPSLSMAQATGSPYSGDKPKAATAATGTQPSARELDAVRAQMKAGQMQDALDALAAMAPTPDVWRLRVEASLGLGRTSAAVEAYDGLAKAMVKEDTALLGKIATAVVRGTFASPDASLAVEACGTLLQRGTDPCSAKLAKDASDSNVLFATRAAALAALARTGDARAASQLRALASGVTGQQQRAVVEAVRDLNDQLAVPVLVSALASDDAGLQYSAANALGSRNGPEAKAALEKFLGGDPDPVARSAARLSLAKLGDTRWQQEFFAILPELDGDMAIDVGELLMKRGDPRGVVAIEKVAKGQHEPLRLAAAARLPPTSSELATSVLGAALASENPWTRALSLQLFRDSSLLPLHMARRSLADTEPWVRLRAAQAVFTRVGADSAGAGSKKR